MDFPTLYKRTKCGKKWQIWSVSVQPLEDDTCVIRRTYGLEHGAMTESTKEVNQGKNIGKKNETTVFEQACAEAKSMHTKYLTIHKYTETKTDINKDLFPGAMLAHSFDKQSKKITFPAFVQPKLDGVRMIAVYDVSTNSVMCYSRTGKKYLSISLQNITNSIKKVSVKNPSVKHFCFDGELYSNQLTFEEIVGICRNTTNPTEQIYNKLEYHIYDLIPLQAPIDFAERSVLLNTIFKDELKNPFLKNVSTILVSDIKQVYTHHDTFIAEGYEGIMIRNKKGQYSPTRSIDLQKFKNFEELEFVIVDVKEATGNDKGTAIIQCQADNGELFWVRPKGSREYRASLLESQIIDKLLTVRYQNLTEKGIPRFPVGIAIRDYE